MKKILLIVIMVCLTNLVYGYSHHYHHYHHSTYHPTYHHTSHGSNGYSKPRTNYYNHPMKYFPVQHHYYNHYHHYHIGNNHDTIFCENSNHDVPTIESEEGVSFFNIILIIIIVGGLMFLIFRNV